MLSIEGYMTTIKVEEDNHRGGGRKPPNPKNLKGNFLEKEEHLSRKRKFRSST